MDRAAVEQFQRKSLEELLSRNLPSNSFLARKLATAATAGLDLKELPFTTKSELLQDQVDHPPYGTNLALPLENYVRLHQTSGTTTGYPLRWLDTADSWEGILECWKQIFRVAGVVKKDRLYFPFSFGPFLGFWAAFEGAASQGNLVLPGGGASTPARIKFLLENSATIVCCTPTYALRMAEVAAEENISLRDSAVRQLILAGEPGANIPATKGRIADAWNAVVLDHWGMTEVGPLAIENPSDPGHLYVLHNQCIAEVVHPETGEAVGEGQTGELVITTLYRKDSPVLRYRTGDLVVMHSFVDRQGNFQQKLVGGIIGRTDEMLFYRGNNVYPSMLEAVIRQFPEVHEFQIVFDTRGSLAELRLRLEIPQETGDVCQAIADMVEKKHQFRPIVEKVHSGTLPRSEMKSKRVVRIQ